MSDAAQRPREDDRLRALVIGAIGVVYGDIGTSPLYALRECFHGPHAIGPTRPVVLGVLSLIFWSLVLVISLKYLVLILRADNQGEGGILALLALVSPGDPRRRAGVLVMLGLFGAALLYGDGVITPAISVLSAVEGLKIATPLLEPYVLPLTIVILAALFRMQRYGTGRVGAIFGPATLLWFFCLGALGIASIVRTPAVLYALSPHHAVAFFSEHGFAAFRTLGSVFLVVTGGEALYADMGHFGKRPIRLAWTWVVLPALALNYLGQGALLLREPGLADNPFYHLAPRLLLYPLVALATFATVIASQAVITGAFSLTWQAVRLGYLPRVTVVHTSQEEIGQVFLPRINQILFVGTVALVLGFRTSSNLAAAYGVAVTTTMVITTLLMFHAMRTLWNWKLLLAAVVSLCFVVMDLGFLGANLLKIADGGWFPLAVGAAVLLLMTTWRSGRSILHERIFERAHKLDPIEQHLSPSRRPAGTMVFLTGDPSGVPPALRTLVHHLQTLPERVILLRIETTRTPFVAPGSRLSVVAEEDGFFRVTGRFGFMESPHVPRLIERCRDHGLFVEPKDVTYVLGRETLLATPREGMAMWREKLFAAMARNAGDATGFFQIPADQVLEIGSQIEL